MTDIIEKELFEPAIPLIEEGDEVKGGVDGAANKQAKALANRTKFLKGESDKLNKKVAGLTAQDVGADKAGDAAATVAAHVAEADPHSQYLSRADAILTYLELSLANQPNGYLQLDSAGKIPAALLSLISTEYLVVADQAGRLAVDANPNLVIVAQADIDTLFYLNGGLDPTVDSNWVKGQAATVSGVSRVFGRTGDIVAELGDYNADQITETLTRLFSTPTEKQTWNSKQEKLISGTNLKTLFGVSLLGSGDFKPTPTDMGAADKTHQHLSADITDFKNNVLGLIGSYIKPGRNITVAYDQASGQTTISSAPGVAAENTFVMSDRVGATANQQHVFNIAPQSSFNMLAFALKAIAGAVAQVYPQDTFSANSAANFTSTDQLVYADSLAAPTSSFPTTTVDGDLYSTTFSNAVKKMSLAAQMEKSLVPAMTGNTTPAGYTASSSSNYDGSQAYLAFDGNSASPWISLNQPSSGAPQSIAMGFAADVKVTRYEVINRPTGFINSPTAWTFQGYNATTGTWTTLDTRTSNNNTAGAVRTFTVASPGLYRSYRLMVTACAQAGALTVGEFRLYSLFTSKLVLGNGSKKYNVVNGDLVEITDTVNAAYIDANGVGAVELTPAMLATLGDGFKVYTSSSTPIDEKRVNFDQIAVGKIFTNASRWSKINALTMTTTVSGQGKATTAVTKDLKEYFVFNGTAWVSIGELKADAASAATLLAQGMQATVVNAITKEQWALFLADATGALGSIAFAYALGMTDYADVAQIKSTMYNVDETGSWKLQSPTEVEIQWKTDAVIFKTVTAGDYKLGYQIS